MHTKRIQDAWHIVLGDGRAIARIARDEHALAMGVNIAAIAGVLQASANILINQRSIWLLLITPLVAIASVFLMGGVLHASARMLHAKAPLAHMIRVAGFVLFINWFSPITAIPVIGSAFSTLMSMWLILVLIRVVHVIYKKGIVRTALIVLIPLIVIAITFQLLFLIAA